MAVEGLTHGLGTLKRSISCKTSAHFDTYHAPCLGEWHAKVDLSSELQFTSMLSSFKHLKGKQSIAVSQRMKSLRSSPFLASCVKTSKGARLLRVLIWGMQQRTGHSMALCDMNPRQTVPASRLARAVRNPVHSDPLHASAARMLVCRPVTEGSKM